MNHGSLFSGIGGFDLASEWMGWDNVFHCEWNEFGQKVLKYYWPNAISYGDITKTDFTIHRGSIDVLTGGFPCQPYSTAGKRLGKEDERHLWPEMLRAIREIAPRWIVGENVRGLVSWNGGMVFDEVQTDLEACGYEVQSFLLPACGVNAPHRRDRIWFVAKNTISDGRLCGKVEQKGTEDGQQRDACTGDSDGLCGAEMAGIAADPNSTRVSGQQVDAGTSENLRQGRKGFTEAWNDGGIGRWDNFPTQSPVCTGDDGIPAELDGITFSKWRNESIKAAGNAIVPQVVYQIFKAIQEYDNQL